MERTTIKYRFNSDLILAFVLGLITAFAFPPYSYLLAAMAAFAVFVLLIFSQPSRAFWYGLLYGLGQFAVAFHWLLPSMTEFGNVPAATAYLIFFAVCVEVALYPALFAYLLPKLCRRQNWFSLLLIPALWVLTEWLRSNMFPFAWNLLGYTFYAYETLLQAADLASVYLLSFLFVFFASALALIIASAAHSVARTLSVLLLAAGVFMAVWFYGNDRLEAVNQASLFASAITVAAIQGNVDQHDKWNRGSSDQVFDIHRQLSGAFDDAVDLIVWPESSLPFFLQDNAAAQQKLKSLALAKNADLLIGADTYVMHDKTQKFFNSMLLLTAESGVAAQYDKFHRVPFGEYMPLKDYLPASLAGFNLSEGFSSVEAGPGVAVMRWRNLTLAPLICYESIFPRHARAQALMGADVYINVANDAWFGEDAKPQHLLMTRLRAIENRRPLVRVSNTGITAMFDAAGRTLVALESGQRGAVITRLPLTQMTAINANYGQYFIVFCVLICAMSLLRRIRSFRN